MRKIVGLVVFTLAVTACGSRNGAPLTVAPGSVPAGSSAEAEARGDSTAPAPAETGCADVIDVEISGNGPYTFAVTVASPDTGWDKYADEWRIESEAGEVLGVRELTHPHVDEQPFTRSLGGMDIDPGTSVVVAARDSVEGYCGERLTITVGR